MIRQAKLFTSENDLNTWLQENHEVQIVSIQFEAVSNEIHYFFVQYSVKDVKKEHSIGFQQAL